MIIKNGFYLKILKHFVRLSALIDKSYKSIIAIFDLKQSENKMKKVSTYICLLLLFVATTVSAVDYKEYKTNKKHKDYFEVQYSRSNDKINYSTTNEEQTFTMGQQTNNRILFKGKTLRINGKDPRITDTILSIDNITDSKITEDDSFITISFYTAKDSSKLARFKKGNRISSDENIHVFQDDFVRGIIFSVSGDITIEGEVNKDVISLFGNINVVGNGVVRGDLASITGKVKVENSAVVYGEIYDRKKKGRGLKHRLFRGQKEFDLNENLVYNRVDGLALSAKVSHQDSDSLLPTLEAEIGIGFASDRGRYMFSIEQVLFREKAIAVGGNFYRQLLSDDDWLISRDENTAFALLAKEDYKDYYEAEGGSIYLKALPSNHVTLKTGYSFYESNWLPSNRHLWALFRGADKLFDPNYASWDTSIRPSAIAEVDTSEIGSIFASVNYYSDSTKSVSEKSNWHISADFEFSQTGLNSDFDYHRYILTVRRLQKINEQSTFTARTVFGNSDGYLPIFKRYHLGGLGTLHGYAHKEYIGTRFWMTNSEYRIDFPKSEFGVSLFWDMGQIADDTKLNSDVEIKQSLGLSIFFEDDFTISIAKRLDRTTNDSPKLYVRFSQIF